MLDKMKYIVIEKDGNEVPIMFSTFVEHSFIAGCIKERYPGIPIIAAGFCTVNLAATKMNCYGNSISLDITSRPKQDPTLFNHLFI